MHVCVLSFHFTWVDTYSGPYDKYMFNSIRNCQTAFKMGCTILHLHQQCMFCSIFSCNFFYGFAFRVVVFSPNELKCVLSSFIFWKTLCWMAIISSKNYLLDFTREGIWNGNFISLVESWWFWSSISSWVRLHTF